MKYEDFSVFYIEFMQNLNQLIDLFKLKNSMLNDFFKKTKKIVKDPSKLITLGTMIFKNSFDENGIKNYKRFTDLKRGMFGDEEHKFSYNFFLEVSKSFTYANYIEFEYINDLILKLTEFEKYLYKCFKFIILQRPNIINKKSITVEEFKMLQEPNLEIVQGLAAEHFLHDLFYKNYMLVFERAIDPLGIKHEIKEEQINLLQGIKLIRNQYIHADGKITSLFLKKLNELNISGKNLGIKKLELNSKIELNQKILSFITYTLLVIGLMFDKKLIESYPQLIAKGERKNNHS